jgi:hypothetical protein
MQFSILGLLSASAVIWAVQPSLPTAAEIFLVIFVLTVAFGVIATKIGLLLRFKWNLEFGSSVNVVLTDNGLNVTGRDVQSAFKWAEYPQSVRFYDGILLKKRGAIRWLPDAGIRSGTPNEVTKLVAAKTSIRHIA